jgi:Flp pilus assembly protein TadG
MRSRRQSGIPGRRGVAAAEFAVCLPVLVLVVFASIEACSMIFLKESLTVAAYEGSRVALQSAATGSRRRRTVPGSARRRNVAAGTVQIILNAI